MANAPCSPRGFVNHSDRAPLFNSNSMEGYQDSSYEDLTPSFLPSAVPQAVPGHQDERGQATCMGRRGYEQRRRMDHAGTFIQPQGTILSLQNPVIMREFHPADQTTETLSVCQETVLKPYTSFLYVVGWLPAFENPSGCLEKAINILHPLFVLSVIIVGYTIQYALCFCKLNGRTEEEFQNSSTVSPPANCTRCQEYNLVLSQDIFLDVLHFLAYGYSFYALRFAEVEQLPTLMERVFIQTAHTEMGVKSQKRLIMTLRALLYCGFAWVLLSRVGEIIHVFRFYPNISLRWMEPMSEKLRLVLLIWMLVSFVLVDVIYMAVIIHYSVQCLLLIRYINTIIEKILERRITLEGAIKEVAELHSHLKVLNLRSGLALSLILLHFGNFAYSGTKALFHATCHKKVILTMFTAGLTTVLWWLAIIVPISIATHLSTKCRHLRTVGHVIRQRPFGFEDIPLAELDSFVLYMSTLSLSSKIFLIPVRIEYIFLAGVFAVLVLLFSSS